MSREILQDIIVDFKPEEFVRFFRAKNRSFAPRQEELVQYDNGNFKDGLKLGEIPFSNTEQMFICSIEARQSLSERSGKKRQYEIGKKILKERQYDAGIFIFYDQQGSFRFSLIYANYLGRERDWSTFRRFTYFVKRELTNKTFLQRIGDGDFSSLEKIKEAFSVEKVTKAFYKEIADWYFWANQNATFPEDAEKEDNGRNIAVIRKITRLIFIWFMKERGLISPGLFNRKKTSILLKDLSPEKTTYYKAILQNLFFATLNTKIEERTFRFAKSFQGKNKDYMDPSIYRYEDYFKNKEDMLEIFRDIPFLNGGLFDCLDQRVTENGKNVEIRVDGFSDKEVGLKVPNFLFFSDETVADLNTEYGTKNKEYKVRGLIDILSAYNFTIDENEPDDQEVALDPELLGKVFENLLASFNPETATTARKATGSYYTPREIVDYMVKQSLKEYFKTHLKDIDDLDNKLESLFSRTSEGNPFNETDTKRAVKLIDDIRIVDPAVGSGAFPMGALNKLVFILSKLDPDNTLWKEAQISAVEQNVPDPVIKQKLKEQIEELFAQRNPDYGRKLYLIQKCIYGVDIQQIAVEIAKLRFFISLLVHEKIDKNKENWGIEPLPNLDFKLMQGNSLISEFMGLNFDSEDESNKGQFAFDEMNDLIKEFQQKKSDFQNQSDRHRKDSLKEEVNDLIIKIFEAKLKRQKSDYFKRLREIEQKYSNLPSDKHKQELILEEKEVLYRKTGFNLEATEKQLREYTSGLKTKPFFLWKLYFSEVFHEKGGFDMVIANPPYKIVKKANTPLYVLKIYSSFCSADFKMNLFAMFIEKSIRIGGGDSIHCYIIPDSALNLPAFKKLREFILDNGSLKNVTYYDENVFENVSIGKSVVLVIEKNRLSGSYIFRHFTSETEFEDATIRYDRVFKDGDLKFIYKFADELEDRLFYKMKNINTTLSKYCEVYDGINPGSKFIRDSLISRQYLDQFSRKIIDGGDFKKYSKIRWDGFYIYYNEKRVNQIRKGLKRQGKPFTARIIKRASFLDHEKIVTRQTADTIIGTIDFDGYYVKNSVHSTIINTAYKNEINMYYVLSILNSNLISWYYQKESLEHGRLFPQVKINRLRKLPLLKISLHGQKPFIDLVANIFALTRSDDYFENLAKQAQVKEKERQIDQLVYKLYGLAEEEIRIVEDQ
jgi:adenine-specific DNA-methyltransferase